MNVWFDLFDDHMKTFTGTGIITGQDITTTTMMGMMNKPVCG